MRMPVQPRYEELLPRFLQALFEPGDFVNVARLVPGPGGKEDVRRLDASYLRDDAIKFLLPNADMPNYYFGASAVDGTGVYGKANCVLARAFYLDIDCGQEGHKGECPFATLEETVGYLLTLPLRPSIAWATGHGLQAAYLLKDPYALGRDPERIGRYEHVGKRLGKMAKSDATFTCHHLFRVPLSLNDKWWLEEVPPEVRGELLWMDDARRYAFEEIEAAVDAYGIDDHLDQAQEEALEFLSGDDGEEDEEEKASGYVPFDQLPEEIRKSITEVEGDRSTQFHIVIGRMVRAGYDDKTILDAVGKGGAFHAKYGTPKRFREEFERSLGKARSEKRRFNAELAPNLKGHNKPEKVALESCAALPQTLSDMLGRYGKACGIELRQRVLDAARFHEHMLQTQKEGVLESPCGSGKSTWAISHIALNAGDGNRYIYVTETVDALYKAADVLDKLAKAPVGRVHSFNREKCNTLCGAWHEWRECNPKDPKAVCHTCAQRGACPSYNRDAERKKPILCMTHEGLNRAIEENSDLLEDAGILVDEGLNHFATWEVTLSDLELLRSCGNDLPLDGFFPCGLFGCADDLAKWNIPPEVDVFARRNYVYRDERQTAALHGACLELRKRFYAGKAILDPFKAKAGDEDRARDTLANLLNFFRPSAAGDASYAFHETRDERGTRYAAKRMRFNLEVPRKYRKLWMLNASAQLCPFPYPANLKVYACPDLPGNSHLVTLHVVRGTPTQKKEQQNVWLSDVVMAIRSHREFSKHGKVLVATDKDSDLLEDIKAKIRAAFGNAEIVHLSRGRIKGENKAGECTLAVLTGMALFTTLDDCALHAALLLRRTYPDEPYVFSKERKPVWTRGGPRVPAIRRYYALRALDEIYQTIYRTAVRNDKPVEAIIAVPSPEWLVLLWVTVMPHFNLGHALRLGDEDKGDGKTVETGGRVPVKALTKEEKIKLAKTPEEAAHEAAHGVDDNIFERDNVIDGLRVICSLPGQEFSKQQLADMFAGIAPEKTWGTANPMWKDIKVRIWPLLAPFFEKDTRKVKRKHC